MDSNPQKRKMEEESNGVKRAKHDDSSEDIDGLKALVQHRTEVVKYYTNKLEDAKKQLRDAEGKLAECMNPKPSNISSVDTAVKVKVERKSPSPIPVEKSGSKFTRASKPPLVIPSVPAIAPPAIKSTESSRMTKVYGGRADRALSKPGEQPKASGNKSAAKSPTQSGSVDSEEKKPKRTIERKEHTELISSIRTSSSPKLIRFQTGCLISSQHKRKLRSLIMNPQSNSLFATSALDGMINLWQLQAKGLNATPLGSTDCLSPGQRRWPEDIAWHPEGDSIFGVYAADGGDSQVSVLNLNATKNKVRFLESKPHIRGIINSISFMPWDTPCFATGGSDHAVVMWNEAEDSWKPKALHRSLHSSSVMGVAGMQHKPVVLSVGADKRVIGYDTIMGKGDFKHNLESKAMGVSPNPTDFNLFMVQTGTPQKQLRLFDIRVRQSEIHVFGWKQESSESQSALINQTWSPDGLYIASGSVDPMFHIFDIRYKSNTPAQSVKAHSKRIFKAAWHCSWPLVVTISSDLHLGLHKIF